LALVLKQLKPYALNEVLTNSANGILRLLVKAAQEGAPQHLALVLKQLYSADLKELFETAENEVLVEYLKKTPEHLVLVLKQLNFDALYTLLNGKVLNHEHLVSALTKLNFADLKALFETAENEVLIEYLKKLLNTWFWCSSSSSLTLWRRCSMGKS
jgi:hypothetical protein